MTATNLDAVRELINIANNLINLLGSLLTTGRPQFAQRIVYIGVMFYLQLLIEQLELIAWQLALEEIQEFIGNEVFTGENLGSEPYLLERMYEIRDGLKTNCAPNDLECIVEQTSPIIFPEIKEAVKYRIIADVSQIVGFPYTGRDANDIALAVTVNGQEIPWDDPAVPASTLFDGVPFSYIRASAVSYASNLSVTNFSAFPQIPENVPAVLGKVDTAPNARNYSSVLNHITGGGATGSAIFISEAIFAGNYPMTIDAEDDPQNPDCSEEDQSRDPGSFETSGWRHCAPENAATAEWKSHEGILTYFTTSPFSGYKIGEINRFRETECVTPSDLNEDTLHICDVVFVEGGTLKENPLALEVLSTLFTTGRLNAVETGDYMVTEGTDPSHGFLIVGWGSIVNTLDGIGTTLSSTKSSSNPIPYVADFCFGTDYTGVGSGTDDATGWLQDPRPRPFYSTVVSIYSNLRSDQTSYLKKLPIPEVDPNNTVPVYQEFITTLLQFYHIPSSIRIPLQRLLLPSQ